jgi:phosphodiesterase/alkaline phosphatase D-like protein
MSRKNIVDKIPPELDAAASSTAALSQHSVPRGKPPEEGQVHIPEAIPPNDLPPENMSDKAVARLVDQGIFPAFPNGISSGDVTQTSAVLWVRALVVGPLTFEIATDANFEQIVQSEEILVTDRMVPVKLFVEDLDPNQQYFYRAVDAGGHTIEGSFDTAAEIGTHEGFHFGVGGDFMGDLAPFVSLKNAVDANLDLFIKLGDTIYADLVSVDGAFAPDPGGTATLEEFQFKHHEVYSSHSGFNYWADLQATTPILAMIDDHEVIDNFAGGAEPSSDPRFASQSGDFINETALFTTGLEAFNQFNAVNGEFYSGTGDDLFDGAPDLYRYNTYGSDAAIILLDQRSFRDEGLSGGGIFPADPLTFYLSSITADRTMLGDTQLENLKQDLLDARDNGIVWKFIMLPEPIQLNGPTLFPEDRYEGYMAERAEILKFIEDNHIENVVFVSSDAHWLSVNNLTYQETPFGQAIESSAIDITTMAVGTIPIAPQIPPFLAALPPENPFHLTAEALALYDSLSNAGKDAFVEAILNNAIEAFSVLYGVNNPIGLDSSQAELMEGSYFVGHSFGWTDFNINDALNGELIVTTYGVPFYTDADLADDPQAVLDLEPEIVSQFKLTPTSKNILGTPQDDINLEGTNNDDVLLGLAGDDGLDGALGNDIFVFDVGFGHDTIINFEAGAGIGDVIEFNSSIFADFSAVQAATTDEAGNAVITYDVDNSVTLQSVSMASLQPDDFSFFAGIAST